MYISIDQQLITSKGVASARLEKQFSAQKFPLLYIQLLLTVWWENLNYDVLLDCQDNRIVVLIRDRSIRH